MQSLKLDYHGRSGGGRNQTKQARMRAGAAFTTAASEEIRNGEGRAKANFPKTIEVGVLC